MSDIATIGESGVPVSQDAIVNLERHLKDMEQSDHESWLTHHFAPGVYLRELFIPEGTVIVGKIHRKTLMNILLSGTLRITTDDGMKTLTGPVIFNAEAGKKKAVFAVTDSIFINIHPTKSTDLAEIEAEFIAPDFESLEDGV